jgi:hypothetical protein
VLLAAPGALPHTIHPCQHVTVWSLWTPHEPLAPLLVTRHLPGRLLQLLLLVSCNSRSVCGNTYVSVRVKSSAGDSCLLPAQRTHTCILTLCCRAVLSILMLCCCLLCVHPVARCVGPPTCRTMSRCQRVSAPTPWCQWTWCRRLQQCTTWRDTYPPSGALAARKLHRQSGSAVEDPRRIMPPPL